MCALFIALITAGTFVRIPIGGDYYTLQFLFTLLAGLVLGGRLGAMAVGTYVLMGLVGIPVFAAGGGPSYILSPTFGYLLGFIVQAYVCGSLSRHIARPRTMTLLGVNLVGMAIVYLFGLVWFYVVSNYFIDTPVSIWWVIVYCGLLQVTPDFLLCVISAALAARFYREGFWIETVPAGHTAAIREA